MRLLLIRHALTPHVGHKLSGWSSGVHLSDEGRAQASRLTERLHEVQIDAIYSSPLDRAVETAQPIAKDHKLRVRQRAEIGEVKYGELEGKSLRTLAKGKLWAKLQTWPSDIRFPGGESLRDGGFDDADAARAGVEERPVKAHDLLGDVAAGTARDNTEKDRVRLDHRTPSGPHGV